MELFYITIYLALCYSSSVWVAIGMLKTFLLHKWVKLARVYDKIEPYLCPKCITFWLVLIITMSPFTAAISAVFAALIDSFLSTVQF